MNKFLVFNPPAAHEKTERGREGDPSLFRSRFLCLSGATLVATHPTPRSAAPSHPTSTPRALPLFLINRNQNAELTLLQITHLFCICESIFYFTFCTSKRERQTARNVRQIGEAKDVWTAGTTWA